MEISLTAIVPVFNEENTLVQSVSNLLNLNIITEVFIVDDASTDSSLKLIKEIEDLKAKKETAEAEAKQSTSISDIVANEVASTSFQNEMKEVA